VILTASLVKTSLFLIPSLTIVMPFNNFYLSQVSSAECSPQKATRWNPITATWIVESGYKYNEFRAFVGHKSYHSIDSIKKLDSYDYIGIQYSKEFK
jgi:hypothetical protein